MKKMKGYKGVVLLYLVFTLINVVWVCNYNKPINNGETVQKDRAVAVNYEKIENY